LTKPQSHIMMLIDSLEISDDDGDGFVIVVVVVDVVDVVVFIVVRCCLMTG